MSAVLDELRRLLDLEELEQNLFRGRSQDLGFGNLFGGQVLGQAMAAATRTVEPARRVHSLHAYFLRPGDPTRPIVYQVERMRDGRSFSTRNIDAIQHGRPICTLSCSFQIAEEGFEHQSPAPTGVPPPDDLRSELEMARELAERIPEPLRTKLLCDKPIEIRPVDPMNPFAPEVRPPKRQSWLRAAGELPDDPTLHRCLLAYASDFGLVGTSLYPHGTTFWNPRMQVASLDHAMWFHRDLRMDRWLLHSMDSPNAAHARGLNRGAFYQDGALVASVVQEGLIRRRAGQA
jgi:acyl-CoA thioesterase-2